MSWDLERGRRDTLRGACRRITTAWTVLSHVQGHVYILGNNLLQGGTLL